MTENNGQLYELVRDLELPDCSLHNPTTNTYIATNVCHPAWFAVLWPNGFPCLWVEWYLLEKLQSVTTRRVDGGSLKAYASDLSHLVRYCWKLRKNLWEIDDDEFKGFVAFLKEERRSNRPAIAKRNRNTVRTIIARCIEFYAWLQASLTPQRVIVGTRQQGAQITCKLKTSVDRRGYERKRLVYAFEPTADSPDPKRPISRDIRQSLWDAVAALSNPGRLHARYKARFHIESELNEELDYLRVRRELLLAILEATGARPGELARLLVSDNKDCAGEGRLVLTTLKRRGLRDPKRRIPVERSVCIKLEVFVEKYRSRLLSRLAERGRKITQSDSVFLCSRNGTPLSERSLTKEFQRIVLAAGIEQRACMSMYRHRFITTMVKLHLLAFMEEDSGKSRSTMTDKDYRTILKRVAVFTGHGDPESLMHYVDLAWEEIGLFDYVQPALGLMAAVDSSLQLIQSIRDEIRLNPQYSAQNSIERVDAELKGLRDRVAEALELSSRHQRGSPRGTTRRS